MSDKRLSGDNAAVQKHLDILQDVIARMAAESRALKTWCITIVAAILILVARGDTPPAAVLIAFLPTVAFGVLDWWYLKRERGFRNAYDDFVGKFHAGQLPVDALFVVNQKADESRQPFLSPFFLFYAVVAASIVSVWIFMRTCP